MDAFTYITVLLSIVLGLAITQVLLGFRGLILTRAKVKLYSPTLIWAVIVLFVPIQAWWADFTMREHPNWTFLALIVILLCKRSVSTWLPPSFCRTSSARTSSTFGSTFSNTEAASSVRSSPVCYSAC